MAKVDPKQLTRYNVAMGRFAPQFRTFVGQIDRSESSRSSSLL
jgi:hypothetical protein